LAPDGQLNPVDLQKILAHLQKYHIHILFPESNVSRDSIRKIASAAKHLGFEIHLCKEALYGDSLKGTYLEAMKHNALVIARNLGT
jgi:manganese/zinc/iron transport system substrate-binding protein